MTCDRCINIGDMGSCQNWRSPYYGKQRKGEKACADIEQKGMEE